MILTISKSNFAEIKEADYFELKAMIQYKVSYQQAKGINCQRQLDHLAVGFSTTEVKSSWYSIVHANAALKRVSHAFLRGQTSETAKILYEMKQKNRDSRDEDFRRIFEDTSPLQLNPRFSS
jgi:hypothetical protein